MEWRETRCILCNKAESSLRHKATVCCITLARGRGGEWERKVAVRHARTYGSIKAIRSPSPAEYQGREQASFGLIEMFRLYGSASQLAARAREGKWRGLAGTGSTRYSFLVNAGRQKLPAQPAIKCTNGEFWHFCDSGPSPSLAVKGGLSSANPGEARDGQSRIDVGPYCLDFAHQSHRPTWMLVFWLPAMQGKTRQTSPAPSIPAQAQASIPVIVLARVAAQT